ncbi:phosphoenolpyruvate carboxykinase [ATP] [Mesobacillus boroniphilus JCM 21738]|uniref:Phosphoenolpyruvate carboxykinase [ATP] n=1 Tax=Mesobacillus boroniphilus JCM 21738 TaxID=1294265 RepID=W4RR62_9BACI|nr:phosphoenolpyruvate carboxykinase [ATP] [Mesobacillus boroniphilus JCM 21738]
MNVVGISNELSALLTGSNVKVQLSVPQLVEKVLNRNEGS